LIRETDADLNKTVPWLGDVPVVGKLFRKRETGTRRTEIVITLVPHITDCLCDLEGQAPVQVLDDARQVVDPEEAPAPAPRQARGRRWLKLRR
jgi:type IV pilus assembly protein PilQ